MHRSTIPPNTQAQCSDEPKPDCNLDTKRAELLTKGLHNVHLARYKLENTNWAVRTHSLVRFHKTRENLHALLCRNSPLFKATRLREPETLKDQLFEPISQLIDGNLLLFGRSLDTVRVGLALFVGNCGPYGERLEAVTLSNAPLGNVHKVADRCPLKRRCQWRIRPQVQF